MRPGKVLAAFGVVVAIAATSRYLLVRSRNRLPAPDSPVYEETTRSFYRGLAELQVGLLDDAKREFTKTTELVSSEPAGWANLGLAHLRLGEFDAAAAPIERAVRLAPRSSDVVFLQGRLETSRGKLDEGHRATTAAPSSSMPATCVRDMRWLRKSSARAVRMPTRRHSGSSRRFSRRGPAIWRCCSSGRGFRPNGATRRRSMIPFASLNQYVGRLAGAGRRTVPGAADGRGRAQLPGRRTRRRVSPKRPRSCDGVPREPGRGPHADRAHRGAVRALSGVAIARRRIRRRLTTADVHAAAVVRRHRPTMAMATSLDESGAPGDSYRERCRGSRTTPGAERSPCR